MSLRTFWTKGGQLGSCVSEVTFLDTLLPVPYTKHLAPGTSPKPGKKVMPEVSFQNAVKKSLFQVPSALQSKVMAKT